MTYCIVAEGRTDGANNSHGYLPVPGTTAKAKGNGDKNAEKPTVCLSLTPTKPFLAFQEHSRMMDNCWRVTSVTSASAGFQLGVPVANLSAAHSTTSSLSSDTTILAAEIVSLRAQLALAVVTTPTDPPTTPVAIKPPLREVFCSTYGNSGNVHHSSAN